MAAPVLIIAIGNESRGDDAMGPLLLHRLDTWLATAGHRAQVELIEDFQLQIEHAMDLAGRQLVLFIDAGMGTAAPYAFKRIRPDSAAATPFSHALAPEAVLAVYLLLFQQEPPPAFALCIRGEQFELGSGLSVEAEARMEQAACFMQELLQQAEMAAWETRLQ